jgi:hypothetical protein
MSWPPGTIVVCVDDSGIWGILPVVKGQYYTVRGYRMYWNAVEVPNVYLNEVISSLGRDGTEMGYKPRRFRIAETTIREIVMVSQKAPVQA